MRASTLFWAPVAILLTAAVAFAFVPSPKATPSPGDLPPAKATHTPAPPNPIHIDQGGDTIASALPIAALPFTDSGTTAGYVDNYAPNCGFAGGAPDVVYRFSPSANMAIGIQLCGSLYDTELYVFQDVAGNIIACNDDSCGLQSQLTNVPLLAGHTYYIIVDGYASSSGAYVLDLPCCPDCPVNCPPGSLLEDEPVCGDNYYDSFNGGCNSVPPVFEPLPFAPTVVCGQYGGFLYAGLSYRDTDWYQITVPAGWESNINWTVIGESDTLCGIINGNGGCPVTSFYAYAYGARCVDHTASALLTSGTWWLWVGTLNFGSVAGPCGQHYVATLRGADCCPLAVEPATWGGIKSLFR